MLVFCLLPPVVKYLSQLRAMAELSLVKCHSQSTSGIQYPYPPKVFNRTMQLTRYAVLFSSKRNHGTVQL